MTRRRRGSGDEGVPLHGRRKTVVVPARPGPDVSNELYPHMLIEDIHLQVIPLGKNWSKRDFEIGLVPHSDELATLLAVGLEPDNYQGLTDAVCHFVREAAQTVMTRGRAVYEIVYMRDGTERIRAMEFAYVPPDSIERDGDLYIQRVPEEVANQWEISTTISVNADSLALFEGPLKPRKLRRLLEALAAVNRPELLDFVEAQMRGEDNVGYSTSEAFRTQELATAELTKDIGWDMRAAFTGRETFLEYYVIVRRLRFERFLLKLRQGLIDQLNRHVRALGEAIGHPAELVVSGLPTESTIDTATRSLEAGDGDFRDILAPFRNI